MDFVECEEARQRRKLLVSNAEMQSTAGLDPVDYIVPNCILPTTSTHVQSAASADQQCTCSELGLEIS